MKIGDTGLELGEFVEDETEEYGTEVEEEEVAAEGSAEEVTEEDQELIAEYGDATKEDFIKAIKTYKGRAIKAEERADFFKDLYNAVPITNPEQKREFKKAIESDEEDFVDDLAKKSDVEDALARDRAYRKSEFTKNETIKFAKEHPDFADRLDLVDKMATKDPKLRSIIEAHPRPWELVYEIAERSGEYVPKQPQGNKADILKKIKENAQKPKPLSDTKSKTVVPKRIDEMNDKEFEEYYAKVRASE